NTLTLLAMVLAIGLVVDDAIVVLENIYRHMEEGKSRLEAALLGSKEIAFAVVAMTLTLVTVYAPLAFATGRTGRLFIEFALALAGAVLVSGFVALTLKPMMCSVLLKHETKHGKVYLFIENLLESLTAKYRKALGVALRHRIIVVLLGEVQRPQHRLLSQVPMQVLLLHGSQRPMMTAHQAEQPTVLATFRVILLPELQEVLVHQTHHVEAVGHDDGIGEVLLSDATVRFRQIHHNHPHVLLARQALQIAAQARF